MLPTIARPIREELLVLAPTGLRNFRKIRYRGDDLCVALAQLAGRDQALLRHFYEILTELLYAISDESTDDTQKWQALTTWLQRHDLDRLIDEVRELGLASHDEDASENLAKAMHDLRGGALSALLGRLQMLDYLPREQGQLNTIFIQTRDHLKIMRSAVTGLDERRRKADATPKAHAMSLMMAKWQNAVVGPRWHERPLRMEIDCHYEGALTDCCLESAAIDRIFYNLAANACRHAAGQYLEMAIFPVLDRPDNECLRFVLSNEVSEKDAFMLRSMVPAGHNSGTAPKYGQSLPALFEPEVSSTGSGFGLTVVADFVAGAFGLRDRAEALRERYLGAVLDGRTFRVWFHWPLGHDDLPQKLDDYQRPDDSWSDV